MEKVKRPSQWSLLMITDSIASRTSLAFHPMKSGKLRVSIWNGAGNALKVTHAGQSRAVLRELREQRFGQFE
jgi:hypothetical protein